jgi:hypothetical protein
VSRAERAAAEARGVGPRSCVELLTASWRARGPTATSARRHYRGARGRSGAGGGVAGDSGRAGRRARRDPRDLQAAETAHLRPRTASRPSKASSTRRAPKATSAQRHCPAN